MQLNKRLPGYEVCHFCAFRITGAKNNFIPNHYKIIEKLGQQIKAANYSEDQSQFASLMNDLNVLYMLNLSVFTISNYHILSDIS